MTQQQPAERAETATGAPHSSTPGPASNEALNAPETPARRFTASTIDDNHLDQLYAENARLRADLTRTQWALNEGREGNVRLRIELEHWQRVIVPALKGERDRARRIAVALENELAAAEAELHLTDAMRQQNLNSAAAAIQRAERAEAERDQMASLVRDFLNPDPCQLDHHGYCQAHAWMCSGSSCPHARAREALAELDTALAAQLQDETTTSPVYDPRAWETYSRDAGCGCTAPNPADCKIPHGTGAWLCVCHRLSGPPIKETDPPGQPLALAEDAIRQHFLYPNRCLSVHAGIFRCELEAAHAGQHRLKCTVWGSDDRHPEPTTTTAAAHTGGNAEDCDACAGTNPPYPFTCPGPDDETPEPEAGCANCGKRVRRISGTLATWWVHDPGGHTSCHPQQPNSPRATPTAADTTGA